MVLTYLILLNCVQSKNWTEYNKQSVYYLFYPINLEYFSINNDTFEGILAIAITFTQDSSARKCLVYPTTMVNCIFQLQNKCRLFILQ